MIYMCIDHLLLTTFTVKANNGCAVFAFLFAAATVLAPETRAVLAGKKARAVQAQRTEIHASEWVGMINIHTSYLLLARFTVKMDSASAATVFRPLP